MISYAVCVMGFGPAPALARDNASTGEDVATQDTTLTRAIFLLDNGFGLAHT